MSHTMTIYKGDTEFHPESSSVIYMLILIFASTDSNLIFTPMTSTSVLSLHLFTLLHKNVFKAFNKVKTTHAGGVKG